MSFLYDAPFLTLLRHYNHTTHTLYLLINYNKNITYCVQVVPNKAEGIIICRYWNAIKLVIAFHMKNVHTRANNTQQIL